MNMTKITEEYEDGVEIETDAKHITIHTKHGEINLFMGNNRKTITSFVSDVKFTTWYNSNPKKTSKFKKADGTRMVILRGE
jgi:hypothetical protein